MEFNSFEDLFNAMFYGINDDDIPEETFDNVDEKELNEALKKMPKISKENDVPTSNKKEFGEKNDLSKQFEEETGVKINDDTLKGFNRFFDSVMYTDYEEEQRGVISAIVKELGTYFILSGLVMNHFEDDLLNYSFMRSKWNIYRKYTFLLGDLFLVDMAYGVSTDDPKQQIQLGITMHSNSRAFFNAIIYFDKKNDTTPKIAFENDSSVHRYSNDLLLKKMKEYFIA